MNIWTCILRLILENFFPDSSCDDFSWDEVSSEFDKCIGGQDLHFVKPTKIKNVKDKKYCKYVSRFIYEH